MTRKRNAFERLPIGALQSPLPEPVMEVLDYCLRTKVLQGNYPHQTLWQDRGTLATLYSAISLDRLSQAGHREYILSHQALDDLKDLAHRCKIDVQPGVATEDLAKRIASIGWHQNAPGVEHVADFLQIPLELIPQIVERNDDDAVCGPSPAPFKSLKLFQLDVADRAADALASPFSRVLIQMPTGSGKTRTAMEIISRFINDREGPTRVLWLAHVRELCDQARDAFVEVWAHVGTKPVVVTQVDGSKDLPEELDDRTFVVGGLQKLFTQLKRDGALAQFDLVVIDEAHKAVAPTYEQVIERTIGWGGRLLGLTATPGRLMGGSTENARMADFFNNQLIGLDAGLVGDRDAELGVMQALQRRGVLARLMREPIETGLKIKLTAADLKAIGVRGDYSAEFLRKVAGDRKRNAVIIEKLIEIAGRGLRTIYFGTNVEQSKMMTALLVAKGIPAAHVDGTTPRTVRAAHATRFKEGKIQVLLNFDVFSTGFDAPKTDAVFIARPTQSVVMYSQMIGRGLRGPAIGGKEACVLVDVVDNLETFSPDLDDIYGFFNEYWASG